MSLTVKSQQSLEASVDINANRSKIISGKVPLINTLALILRVDVCGQMLVFLQRLSDCQERTRVFKSAICLDFFAGQGLSEGFLKAAEWLKSTKQLIRMGICTS